MSHRCYRYPRSITAQYSKPLLCLCSLKKRTQLSLRGEKTSCLKNQIIPERSAAEIYCLSTAKITKKTGKTRPMSQCQRLQIKLQVGAKHRTGIKNPLKTYFQKKSDPFWTLSRKDWNNLPYFFPRKYDHNKINNKVTQQPWKMDVFQMSYSKNESKNLAVEATSN